MLCLGHLQTLFAAFRSIYFYFRVRKQLFCHHQVHGVVIYNQQPGLRRLKALLIMGFALFPHTGFQCKYPQLRLIHNLLLQCNQKGGAFGIHTVDADFTPHEVHKLFYYAQTKPCPLDMAVLLLIHPMKRVKQIGNVLFLHSLARIFHGIINLHLIFGFAFTAHQQCYRSFLRIFYSVI